MNQWKYTHKLSKTIEFQGEKYSEITFDFDKRIGKDALEMEAELKADGVGIIPVDAFDGSVQTITAVKASGVAKDVLLALPIRDFLAIKNEARKYLTGSYDEIADKIKAGLENMTGDTDEQVENELRAEGRIMFAAPETDTQFCIKIAARALGTTENAMLQLPMNEFLFAKLAVQLYLVGAEIRRRGA